MSKFLGFMFPDVDGTPMFFQFLVMPYGCKPAVAVVTKMLKPLKSYFYKLGIRFSVYVDAFVLGQLPAVNDSSVSSWMSYSVLAGAYSGKKLF